MHLPINNLKWDFYALYELPLYAPFTLSKEDMFECMLQFYFRHKQVTNRQLIALFSTAWITLTYYKKEYDYDLQRRNAYIERLANKYAHCVDKDRRIERGLRWFMSVYTDVQIMIYVIWISRKYLFC
jgi:DNA-binding helix-hairpin-helix protein with protein kinase domain